MEEAMHLNSKIIYIDRNVHVCPFCLPWCSFIISPASIKTTNDLSNQDHFFITCLQDDNFVPGLHVDVAGDGEETTRCHQLLGCDQNHQKIWWCFEVSASFYARTVSWAWNCCRKAKDTWNCQRIDGLDGSWFPRCGKLCCFLQSFSLFCIKREITTVVNSRLLTNLADYLGGLTTQRCSFSFLSLMKW